MIAALASAAVFLLAGCGQDAPAADETPIPLETPAALLAADGTRIPLPPNVAATGTESQRGRYVVQVLAIDHLESHAAAARFSCASMDTGTPPIGAVGATANAEHVDAGQGSKIVYAGALSYCPAHRSTFDNLATLAHGGLASAPSASDSSSSTTTTTRAPRSTTRRAPSTTTKKKPTSRADTSSGCGQRAVTRGVFNPSCSEYQGYLDPGRAAGRAPSSSDIQHDDGCQQGYIPKSEC